MAKSDVHPSVQIKRLAARVEKLEAALADIIEETEAFCDDDSASLRHVSRIREIVTPLTKPHWVHRKELLAWAAEIKKGE